MRVVGSQWTDGEPIGIASKENVLSLVPLRIGPTIKGSLVSFTRMYDNVHEHPDSPEDSVVERR